MNRKNIFPALLALAGISVIGLVAWYFIYGFYSPNDSSVNTSNTNGALSNAPRISVAELCDCYIVAGNLSADLVIDLKTGRFVDFLPITKAEGESQYRQSSISQSNIRFAAITEGGKNIEYRRSVTEVSKNVYTAPNKKIINWLTWAGDSETLLIGVGNEEDLQPAEGAHPTSIIALNLVDGTNDVVISQSNLEEKSIEEIIPLVATDDAKKILLSTGGMDEQEFWTWTASEGLKLLNKNFVGSIYFASAQIQDQTKFLTYNDGLHVFDVDTETEIVYPMAGWSDSPVSQPSPDGKYIVFLKQDEMASRGFPTLLSLTDGKEYRLTNNAVGGKGSMAGSFWSSDGTRFAFNRDYSKPAEYSVVDTQQVNQTPKLLELPTTLGDNTIYRLIPKN